MICCNRVVICRKNVVVCRNINIYYKKKRKNDTLGVSFFYITNELSGAAGMESKLFKIGLDLANNFPKPIGNLQKDIITFQKIQTIIVDLFQEKVEANHRGKWDDLLLQLVIHQKDYMEKMIYGDE